MNSTSRVLPSVLLALALTACGDGDNTPTTTADDTTGAPVTTTGEPVTTGEPATTGDGTTTDAPAPTTDGTSMGVDPCDSCDANASCEGDTCVCDEGYEGDGASCEDVDECAGDNDCAVDATCSNTPGGYDCTCDVGYKGDGETCKDVDECTEDLDTCSNNADCANQDGGFKCTCKAGFTGDGMTCNGSKEFGDACTAGEDCASGLCLAGDFGHCSVACTQDVANDCGAQGVTGLCVAVAVDAFWCAGDLSFGVDKDDEVMQSGDKVTRQFQSKTDTDLFLVNIAVAGEYLVIATPDPDDDIQLDFYNGDATELGTVNMLGIGESESGVVTSQPGVFFVVARNIGNSNGGYTIEIAKQ